MHDFSGAFSKCTNWFFKGGECDSCATWLFASSFVANKDKRGARGGRKAGREGGRGGGMRPVLNLVQTPQAATMKGIFFFYQGLPARLLWQFNPLPIYKNGGSESDTERELECDKKKKKKEEEESGRVLSSYFLPHTDIRCFTRLLRILQTAWFTSAHFYIIC